MSSVRYPAVIDLPTDRTAWVVVVPDLPGCTAAGDSLPEAMAAARVAVRHWLDAARANGRAVPAPSPVEVVQAMPEHRGRVVRVIELELDAGQPGGGTAQDRP